MKKGGKKKGNGERGTIAQQKVITGLLCLSAKVSLDLCAELPRKKGWF